MAASTNWLPLSPLTLGQLSLQWLFGAPLPRARLGYSCGLRLTCMRSFLFLLGLWYVLLLVSIPFARLTRPAVGTSNSTPSLALYPPSGPACLARCICRPCSMLVGFTVW